MTSPRPDHAAVVELARHAPSVHNTQPWHFEDDHGVLTLRRDETRRLPVLDPDARQQTLSCGAALFLAASGCVCRASSRSWRWRDRATPRSWRGCGHCPVET